MKLFKVLDKAPVVLTACEDQNGNELKYRKLPEDCITSGISPTAKVSEGRWKKNHTYDILTTYLAEQIVSKGVYSILARYEISECILPIPTIVYDRKGNKHEEYFLLHDNGDFYDIIDCEKSELVYYGKVLCAAEKIVVKQNEVPKLDLFKITPGVLIVSEQLFSELSSRDSNELRFEEIEIA